MFLYNLIDPIMNKTVIGSSNPDICAIAYDSRKIVPGAIFICIKGDNFDGHNYIDTAIKNGAAAIVISDKSFLESIKVELPIVIVDDTRIAMPIIVNRFFDYPSKKLKLIGVTGTKGKTTTTYLIDSIIKQSGVKTGVIGTMGAIIDECPVQSSRTTPESADLQELFCKMLEQDVSAAIMEVSSHALVKNRTLGCEFDVAIYTNLTHEHLDFHNTLDEYFDAKMILFRDYPLNSSKPFVAVVNADDPRFESVCKKTNGRILSYGINNKSDIMAKNITGSAKGISFDVVSIFGDFHVDLKLGGMFNVYNSLAAIGSAFSLDICQNEIKNGLEAINSVDGRFEAVKCGQKFDVIVDYAHTPDSLDNVLRSAREITENRLILVFGCGGNRDKAKRPMMGNIGTDKSDFCIITSDNPRKEDPEIIISEIAAGINNKNSSKYECITDRRSAIEKAVLIAKPGDMVVIAGKGHENYMELANETIHFDDREIVREIIQNHKRDNRV